GQRGEQSVVENVPLFIGHFALPVIEGQRDEMVAYGHAQTCRLGSVVIDDEIERRTSMCSGQARQGKVLDPDAGMKEFGLVPRNDQDAVVGPGHAWSVLQCKVSRFVPG